MLMWEWGVEGGGCYSVAEHLEVAMCVRMDWMKKGSNDEENRNDLQGKNGVN